MDARSIQAYDAPGQVASYDADIVVAGLKRSSVFWAEHREVVMGGQKAE